MSGLRSTVKAQLEAADEPAQLEVILETAKKRAVLMAAELGL
ncbi:hypothetical protein [Candidatus Halocynthiibacter alkanivorans]|nr:hypothetical protein [Candidatus Halocynthiibacter alkanivorans]